MPYCVYIMTNEINGTLYIGRTENLPKRIYEHRHGLVEGFSKKYGLTMLVYVEVFVEAIAAANRERQLKNWKRQWKINLIEQENPLWRDLYDEINV